MIEDKVLRSYLLGTFLVLYLRKMKVQDGRYGWAYFGISKYQKISKMMVGKTYYLIQIPQYYWIVRELSVNIKKANIIFDVCFHFEGKLYRVLFLKINLT